MLRKDAQFVWTEVQSEAFSLLKQALCSAPVLALPDFSQPFHIETDACAKGIGAVLQQQGHPLAFISKALGPRTQGLSTYEKEYMAILFAVEQWRHNLLQGEFFIHTDQRSLVHINEQRLNTSWQQKAFAKLLSLQYKIVYRKVVESSAADALFRRSHPQQLWAVSSVTPAWLTEVVDGYTTDPQLNRSWLSCCYSLTATHLILSKMASSGTSLRFGWVPIGRFRTRFCRHCIPVLSVATLAP